MINDRNLTILASDGDFTLWRYRSHEGRRQIADHGYFTGAHAAGMRGGDLVLCEHGDGFSILLIDEDLGHSLSARILL